MRHGIAATACVLLFCLAAPEAAPGNGLDLRIEGKILRKASGRLVLSFSSFELSGAKKVEMENHKTGEKRSVALSSIYRDICYSEHLPAAEYDSFEPGDWLPYTVWTLPDDLDVLRARISSIYEYQNDLRRELGRALLEEGGEMLKVTSRLTLNKIEKFHRIAALLAAESLKIARERNELNSFLAPFRIRIGFNPFVGAGSEPRVSSLHDVREVIYWEAHRVLTRHFGISDSMVDLVFDAPSTLRALRSFDSEGVQDPALFSPGVTIEGALIHCALYIQRQEFDGEVKQLVRAGDFRDPFITDRPVVDRLVNEGKVAGIQGNRVAVTFAPPFMKPGETLYIMAGGEAKDEIPVVLADTSPDGGYTLTGELPGEVVGRIRAGMPVRRK
ncbi:MAG: hypothetical protein HW377_839 [Actinobacteria bacterium]|nr:hypothetical protein [Actinomycetota bacterium]